MGVVLFTSEVLRMSEFALDPHLVLTYSLVLITIKTGAQMRGVWEVSHPPIISTLGPSCNLMGRSRSRSGPVCIEFLLITPLADRSSVGAVIYYSKAALTYFLGRTDLISGY